MAKKNTLWFPHDYNARADEKTAALISDHGAEGYGIYTIVTEMLHESEDSMIEYSDKKLRRLATSCKTSFENLKLVIDDCIHVYELWTMSDNKFYSNRVIRNKHDRESLRMKRVENGRRGGDTKAKNVAIAKQILPIAKQTLPIGSQILANSTKCLANPSKLYQNVAQDITEQDKTEQNIINDDDDNKGGGGNFEPNPLHIPGVEPFQHIDVIATEYLTSTKYEASRQQLCISLYIKPDALEKIVAEFNAMLTIETKTQRQAGDWVSHLRNWIRKTGRNSPQVNTSTKVDKTQEILLKRQSKIS